MSAQALSIDRHQLREELIVDLARGGYIYREGDPRSRYFDKYVVLSRPGLVNRTARLLADLIPTECERIAVTGIPAAVLGSALAEQTGIPLLLALDGGETSPRFGGETFPRMRTILLEDVVDTGGRAMWGARGLEALEAEVLTVVCLLDREAGAPGRLADAGFALRALFTESQLLAHGARGRTE